MSFDVGPIDGEAGSMVARATQKFLSSRGESPGPEDGIWGRCVTMALQRFLTKQGYNCGPVDGDMGSHTTRMFQKWLKAHGFDPGPVDGHKGLLTVSAWQRFLRDGGARLSITVNVYKLIHKGLPVWHSGVVVKGREYFFSNDNRVHVIHPRKFNNHFHREILAVSLHLNETTLEHLASINRKYKGRRYDLVRCNCNTYANEVFESITGYSIDREYLEHSGMQDLLASTSGTDLAVEFFKMLDPEGVDKWDQAFEQEIRKIPVFGNAAADGGKRISEAGKNAGKSISEVGKKVARGLRF